MEDVAPPPAPPGHAEVLADLDVAAAVGLMGAPAAEVPVWCTPSTADALRRSQARPWCLSCLSRPAVDCVFIVLILDDPPLRGFERASVATCALWGLSHWSMLQWW